MRQHSQGVVEKHDIVQETQFEGPQQGGQSVLGDSLGFYDYMAHFENGGRSRYRSLVPTLHVNSIKTQNKHRRFIRGSREGGLEDIWFKKFYIIEGSGTYNLIVEVERTIEPYWWELSR